VSPPAWGCPVRCGEILAVIGAVWLLVVVGTLILLSAAGRHYPAPELPNDDRGRETANPSVSCPLGWTMPVREQEPTPPIPSQDGANGGESA
jgi:hypothetical protein